ncbi:ATP-binding cassette domain-containing protein [Glycomyces sp. L485]|uniref:ATP-binding cassette domain-containing protein n=1 Tax=Glycomyces sp. L485 TaxID=2909235 RepID=UPI001F4A3B7C|nr:ATP-binding cassette domain-containing protein [Glycomyces sp. L485]MCH7232675.1 ATP-binding cassette domain-containing protein [Glycomyces sp. L485]
MDYAFKTEGLVKRFGKTTALAGVDLAAEPGTVLEVLGPNGAGKTTAIRILATLLRPDEGRAEVGGLDLARHAAEARSEGFAVVDGDGPVTGAAGERDDHHDRRNALSSHYGD